MAMKSNPDMLSIAVSILAFCQAPVYHKEPIVVIERTPVHFSILVRRMRAAQIAFFKTKSTDSLIEARKLEKEVDKWLDDGQFTGDGSALDVEKKQHA
jgi:hypothetical protein